MSGQITAIIQSFYDSFSKGNVEDMVAHYHSEAEFEDPAFGKLKGEEIKYMWRMLVKRSKGELSVTYSDIKEKGDKGSAKWIAVYPFGPLKRKVTNHIQAEFEFKDGKIIRHRDRFSLWKWSGQALGWKGWLLGWTAIFKKQFQQQSRKFLAKFQRSY
jgi:ketosteroid isomerase-like protein